MFRENPFPGWCFACCLCLSLAGSACGPVTGSGPPRLPPPPPHRAPTFSLEPLVMPDDPEVPVQEALADGYDKRFPLRTHVLSISRASWVRRGRPAFHSDEVDLESPGERQLLVVLQRHPESARVILDSHEVRLTVYLPLRALQPTPVAPVKLWQDREPSPSDDVGITVHPSVDGRWRRRRGGFWQFTHHREGVHFAGRLPVSQVTWVFDPDTIPRRNSRDTHLLRNGTGILDRPSGTRLARIHEKDGATWNRRVRVIRTVKEHALVALDEKEYRIQGWVKDGNLKPIPHLSLTGTGGYGTTGGWGSSRSIMVEAGTRLHACPDGPQVGIVRKRTYFMDEFGSGKGFRQLFRHDPWLRVGYSVCVAESDLATTGTTP